MLRWWNREIRIVLCADWLMALGVQWRGRPLVFEKSLISVEHAAGEPAWRPALETLDRYFRASAPRSPVTLVLSNRFVRYAVVPWHKSVIARDEQLALARHRFKEQYGDKVTGWVVRLGGSVGYGESNVACGVDSALISGIQDAARRANVRLKSVQPYLMSAFNEFRRELAEGGDTCLATVESDTLCLAWFGGLQWRGVKTRRSSGDWGQGLDSMLLEEVAEGGLEQLPANVHVFAPEQGRAIVQTVGTRLNRLEVSARTGFSPITDGRFAMGMCGIR